MGAGAGAAGGGASRRASEAERGIAFVQQAGGGARGVGAAERLGLATSSTAAEIFSVFNAHSAGLLGAGGGAAGAQGVAAMAGSLQSELLLVPPSKNVTREDILFPSYFMGETDIVSRYLKEVKKRKAKAQSMKLQTKLEVWTSQ